MGKIAGFWSSDLYIPLGTIGNMRWVGGDPFVFNLTSNVLSGAHFVNYT